MLPIGIQDFEKLRKGGYTYVDKTGYFAPLLEGGYYFLSRPRRFGKSLLVSTLKALFEGKKELFEGLWIYDQHDFKARPIIHIDFSGLDFRDQPLGAALLEHFKQIGEQNGLEIKAKTPKNALKFLIQNLGKSEAVVILVDEYDKPLTDFLDNPTKRQENQDTLKSVYGLLKPMDPYLHLVFLTGVSKFGKLSLFSDLNNLSDISLLPGYALMLGYTKQEIEQNFGSYLKAASNHLKLSQTQLWEQMQLWYNGYSWDGKNKVYCPFSMLTFLNNPVFKGYWYETGTPTFLLKLIKEQQIDPFEFEGFEAADPVISVANIDQLDAISLMFQTGYLTIQQQEPGPRGILYTLSYPNEEVRQAFSTQLIAEYAKLLPHQVDSLGTELYRTLQKQDWPTFFAAVNRTIASIPYQVFKAQESYFHSLMHLMLVSTGYGVRSEESTNRGRMDTVVEMPERVVIFEFKLEDTAQAAIQQIKKEGYADKFNKPVTLVGVVFDRDNKQVGEWAVE